MLYLTHLLIILIMNGNKEAVVTINSDTTFIGGICTGLRDDITLTISDIECIQAKGTLYMLNLPEDIWQVEETDGRKYFNLKNEDSYTTYWEDTYIRELSRDAYHKYEKEINK